MTKCQQEEGLARQRARKVRKQPPEDVTVEDWLCCWYLMFPDDRSPRTRAHNQAQLAPFRRRYGPMRVADVTFMLAQSWALAHPSQVRFLERPWRKAVLMRLAPVNVWSKAVIEMPRRTKPHRRPPTPLELEGILARIEDERFRDMVIFAAYTGARQGGILALRRRDVDLDANRVLLREKGGKARRSVLCGPSRDALIRTLDWYFTDRVWPGWTQKRIQQAWRDVRGEFPFGFHALRSFAATWMRAQGVDALDVALQLGHTDSQGRPYARLVNTVYDLPDPEIGLGRLETVCAPAG